MCLLLLLEGCLGRQGLRMRVEVLVRVLALETLLLLHIAAPVIAPLPLLVVMVPSTATVIPASIAVSVMAIPTPTSSSSSRAISGLPLPPTVTPASILPVSTLVLVELLRQIHDIIPVVPREAWHAHAIMNCDSALIGFGATQQYRLVLSFLGKGEGPAMDSVVHHTLKVAHIGARRRQSILYLGVIAWRRRQTGAADALPLLTSEGSTLWLRGSPS